MIVCMLVCGTARIDPPLSIGFDADIALQFHEAREANPSHFKSRSINKLWCAVHTQSHTNTHTRTHAHTYRRIHAHMANHT